jgi:tetratricopeptide (TPR) repeat protein
MFSVLNNCQNRQLDPKLRIDACTTLIHGNLVSHKLLAALYGIRGEAYFEAGDRENALADYSKAIELGPFPEAYAGRAELLEQEGKTGEADQDRERAGFYYLTKGDCDAALSNYNAALGRDSKIAAALYGRGLCEAQKDPAASAADLSAARALDSGIESKYSWPKE